LKKINGIHCLQNFAVTFNETVVNFVQSAYCFAKECFEKRIKLKKLIPKKQSCNSGAYCRGWLLRYIEILVRDVNWYKNYSQYTLSLFQGTYICVVILQTSLNCQKYIRTSNITRPFPQNYRIGKNIVKNICWIDFEITYTKTQKNFTLNISVENIKFKTALKGTSFSHLLWQLISKLAVHTHTVPHCIIHD
jgi:hypothetical protein